MIIEKHLFNMPCSSAMLTMTKIGSMYETWLPCTRLRSQRHFRTAGLLKYIQIATQEGILNLPREAEAELSPTSATVTSSQRQARFEATPLGLRSEVHCAALTENTSS